MKKYSILGMALITASAITAFLVPTKSNASNDSRFALNGHLTISDNPSGPNDITCKDGIVEGVAKCSYTVTQLGAGFSNTTGAIGGTLTVTGNVTGSLTTVNEI